MCKVEITETEIIVSGTIVDISCLIPDLTNSLYRHFAKIDRIYADEWKDVFVSACCADGDKSVFWSMAVEPRIKPIRIVVE